MHITALMKTCNDLSKKLNDLAESAANKTGITKLSVVLVILESGVYMLETVYQMPPLCVKTEYRTDDISKLYANV